ncbi:hypothetical protein TKK_0001598 [Trichogramma kaykai]
MTGSKNNECFQIRIYDSLIRDLEEEQRQQPPKAEGQQQIQLQPPQQQQQPGGATLEGSGVEYMAAVNHSGLDLQNLDAQYQDKSNFRMIWDGWKSTSE